MFINAENLSRFCWFFSFLFFSSVKLLRLHLATSPAIQDFQLIFICTYSIAEKQNSSLVVLREYEQLSSFLLLDIVTINTYINKEKLLILENIFSFFFINVLINNEYV